MNEKGKSNVKGRKLGVKRGGGTWGRGWIAGLFPLRYHQARGVPQCLVVQNSQEINTCRIGAYIKGHGQAAPCERHLPHQSSQHIIDQEWPLGIWWQAQRGFIRCWVGPSTDRFTGDVPSDSLFITSTKENCKPRIAGCQRSLPARLVL